MKKLCLCLFVFLLFRGCKTELDLNSIVTNSTLRDCLNQIIAHEDSLMHVYPTYGLIESFTITFLQENRNCYIELMADFNIYDSHAMDGYFIYKEKYVSVYGLASKCGDNFINARKLKQGEIHGLFDFDSKAFDEAIKMNKIPLPPPPPGEPYYRKYLIDSPSLVKVEDYDDQIKSFRENKYQK